MLFNSQVFIFVFLPSILLIYWITRWLLPKFAISVLVAGSLFFYIYWKWEYIFILFASVIFNYAAYLLIRNIQVENRKKIIVGVAIAINLGLLGFYKYSGFFINDALGLAAFGFESPVLPLAISFFTFQQIAFIVDEAFAADERINFDEYAAFVTFFPQLIAGPIVRHSELIPQLKAKVARGYFIAGIMMFSIGLAKKVLIADSFAKLANLGFENAVGLNFSDAWLAALSYTMQLYFDFSGYSDMAIGLGLLFGFRLPQNFNSPYKALSIQDFWQRWHMTLSRWLRDYLYIPLGGNRKGSVRTYINLLLTMVLGGLWHGAAWTFVFWGALHGVGLALNRAWSRLGIELPNFISWSITFIFVVFAWVVFRATSFGDAIAISSTMLGLGGELQIPISWSHYISQVFSSVGVEGVKIAASKSLIPTEAWAVFGIFILIVVKAPNSHEICEKAISGKGVDSWIRIAFIGAMAALAIKRLMESSVQSEFLYFQF